MSESSDIPTGTYSLSLGKSFDTKGRKNDPKAAQFHTLRYDFKPSSVSNNADTFIAFGNNSGDVHVSVPSEGDNMTVYKGSKKDAKPKECLLFFDKKTGTVRLEKITSNINVKKTRDLDPGTELSLKRGIERLRTSSSNQHRSASSTPEERPKSQHFPETAPPARKAETSDSESDSEASSDSDKSAVDSSDDDENALLAQMKQPEVTVPSSSSAPSYHQESHVAYNQFGSSKHSSSHNKNKVDSEKYGLALSESSDEDD
ncbi:CRE-EAF-1 protein [Caenorhabditis remanei]|uniref:Ell-associated factor Eaf n=1 Tax=Caenorhabditis remanei TaxID=31234 RepID=E3LXJ4_CAERE|nr:CRE-EAF-1 protein [Caenorhabditis remanei]